MSGTFYHLRQFRSRSLMAGACVVALVLFTLPASAEITKIPWHGDYAHNSTKTWSEKNLWDSGFSKNFLNGSPEEGGKVQKDGDLQGEIWLPPGKKGPFPFMIQMHGCTGYANVIEQKVWARSVVDTLVSQGIGVLILDSFTTRGVKRVCGLRPGLHWARRRADDAYSALDYLIEHKLAIPDQVYLMGESSGGSATLVAMSKKESDHPNKFAAGFPIVPSCYNPPVFHDTYVRPLVMFGGEKDDANPVRFCIAMMKQKVKRPAPMQLVVYKDANHGFMENWEKRTVYGWTNEQGKIHWWHLSYDKAADEDMMETIIAAIKTRAFAGGIENRPK